MVLYNFHAIIPLINNKIIIFPNMIKYNNIDTKLIHRDNIKLIKAQFSFLIKSIRLIKGIHIIL